MGKPKPHERLCGAVLAPGRWGKGLSLQPAFFFFFWPQHFIQLSRLTEQERNASCRGKVLQIHALHPLREGGGVLGTAPSVQSPREWVPPGREWLLGGRVGRGWLAPCRSQQSQPCHGCCWVSTRPRAGLWTQKRSTRLGTGGRQCWEHTPPGIAFLKV